MGCNLAREFYVETSPDFQVGSTGSLLIALRGFYRGLSYRVELAWIRADGICVCGDAACGSDPHFVPENALESTGVHLVMSADNALAMRGGPILQKILARTSGVPVLRHGGTAYVFVSDPHCAPKLFPVLGTAPRTWIPLPPHYSDNEAGEWRKLPSWLTPLSVSAKALPPVAEVFGAAVLGRSERLGRLGDELSELLDNGAISLDEIVGAALEHLALEASAEAAMAFLAALCIAQLITVDRAYQLLDRSERLLECDGECVGVGAENFHRAIAGVLFGDQDFAGEAIKAVLQAVLAELADFDGDEDEDWSTEDDGFGVAEEEEIDGGFDAGEAAADGPAPEPTGENSGGIAVGWECPDEEFDDDLAAGSGNAEMVPLRAVDDKAYNKEIDWAAVLQRRVSGDPALSLAILFLGMSELGLDAHGLTKLAVLDMATTVLGEPMEDLASLLGYLWPSAADFMADLDVHRIAVQLFAALLWRFRMIAEAGMHPGEPDLLSLIERGAGGAAVSELIGAPSVLFWLERHVLAVSGAEALAKRVGRVAWVMGSVGYGVLDSVSTGHLLSLLQGRLDD